MPDTYREPRHCNPNGLRLLLAGVAIAIVSQVWPGIPICGAIALIAWGASQAVANRPGLLLLAGAVYAPLGVVAVMAQVDLAMRADSLQWAALAGLDAAIAITLLLALARQTGELLARWALP
jgi:hypothetical protein